MNTLYMVKIEALVPVLANSEAQAADLAMDYVIDVENDPDAVFSAYTYPSSNQGEELKSTAINA